MVLHKTRCTSAYRRSEKVYIQHLVWVPHARLTASVLCAGKALSLQRCSRVPLAFDEVGWFLNPSFDHTPCVFSAGFRSGGFSGQSSSVIPGSGSAIVPLQLRPRCCRKEPSAYSALKNHPVVTPSPREKLIEKQRMTRCPKSLLITETSHWTWINFLFTLPQGLGIFIDLL